MDSSGRSLADRVTDAVRLDIIEGRLPAGVRLTETSLAEQQDTSRVPVREALRRLEAEGFVTVERNRGATVASLTDAEARSLLEVRGVLEVLVARTAAQRRTAEDLAALERILEAGLAAEAAGDREALIDLNTQFHHQLVVASGNHVAGELLSGLRRKVAWIYSRRLSDGTENSWREHAAILQAVREQDLAGAELLIGAHIHHAQRALRLTNSIDPSADVGATDATATDHAGNHAIG